MRNLEGIVEEKAMSMDCKAAIRLDFLDDVKTSQQESFFL